MSWSVNFSGKVSDVVSSLKGQSESLAGDSKQEYDAALPHLVALVEQNTNTTDQGEAEVMIQSFGSAYNSTTAGRHCDVQVHIKRL